MPNDDRSENQTERSAADGRVVRRRISEEAKTSGQILRIKFRGIKKRSQRSRDCDKNRPRQMCGPIDSHAPWLPARV